MTGERGLGARWGREQIYFPLWGGGPSAGGSARVSRVNSRHKQICPFLHSRTDQLLKYQFDQIFPGCRLLDIHEYLLEKGFQLNGEDDTKYLYHDPCHSPMKTYKPQQLVDTLMGQSVKMNDRCCGESGTFAVNRPDIATPVRFRKEKEINKDVAVLTGKPVAEKVR